MLSLEFQIILLILNDFIIICFAYIATCIFVVFNKKKLSKFCYLVCIQGQFPYPLHTLEEAMLQYLLGILDVLEESSHSSSVHPATTPFPLITLVAIMYLTGMFT